VPDIDPTDLLGFLIQDVARLMSRTFEQQHGELSITRSQARLLAYISLNEGAKQSDIALLMDVQKITLSKMTDDLETKNLVERRADPTDRRVRKLYMTADAKPVLEGIWQRLLDVSTIALSAVPKSRRRQFLVDLMSIREHLLRTLMLTTQQENTVQS